MALTAGGEVWTWGENGDSQLGLGTPPVDGETRPPDVTPRYAATRVPGLSGAVAVGPGLRHSMVLMEDGTVRAFGNNQNGQMGDGTTSSRCTRTARCPRGAWTPAASSARAPSPRAARAPRR
nr:MULTISPECIES: hypothetical protein [unclassified Myxococcus]